MNPIAMKLWVCMYHNVWLSFTYNHYDPITVV
jgi:hypothetical protein